MLTQLPDDLLQLTDRMTMATSLECRVPFLDNTMIDLSLRMPSRFKIRGRELKYIAEARPRRAAATRDPRSAASADSARRWARGSRDELGAAPERSSVAGYDREARSVSVGGGGSAPSRSTTSNRADHTDHLARPDEPRAMVSRVPRRPFAGGRDGRPPREGASVKILFVCHRFPFPPQRGGKIRPFNVIRHLSQQHEVTVASLARSAEELAGGSRAGPALLALHRGDDLGAGGTGAHGRPTADADAIVDGLFSTRQRSRRRIRRSSPAARFDLIFVHCAFVAPYVVDVTAIPKVLDFGDMDSQKWLAYAPGAALPAVARLLSRRASSCAVRRPAWPRGSISARARRGRSWPRWRATACRRPTGWFPNGVDTEYFPPRDTHVPIRTRSASLVAWTTTRIKSACSTSAETTLPLLRARRPGTTTRHRRGGAAARDPRRSAELPGVTVTGSVPDVRPYLRSVGRERRAADESPAGRRTRSSRRWRWELPTVASVAAAGGVDAEPGRHLLTAVSPASTPTRSSAPRGRRPSGVGCPRPHAPGALSSQLGAIDAKHSISFSPATCPHETQIQCDRGNQDIRNGGRTP